MNTQNNLRITFFEGNEQELPEGILDGFLSMDGRLFKDNSNSFVKLINYKDRKLVLKEPRAKNKRVLTRLLTLFRDSRAVQALKSMAFLRQHAIETNRPICALEYLKYGMVFRAYFIYEYLEGEAIKPENFSDLAIVVQKMNQLGYGHSDCHRGNFLTTQNGVAPIDFVLRKNWYGRTFEDLQYLKLFNHLSDAEFEKLYPYPMSVQFMLSRALFKFKILARQSKKHIKKHKYFLLLILLGYTLYKR